jgi:putative permease
MQNLLNKFLTRYFSNEESIYFGLLLLSSFLFIYLFGSILLPVLVSIVVAFLLNGLLSTLRSINLSHRISLFLTLFIFFSFYVSLFFLLPSLGKQINSLIQSMPLIAIAFQENLELLSQNYPEIFSEDGVNTLFANLTSQFSSLLNNALGQLAGTISFVINTVFFVVLVPIMVFFFLKDKEVLLPMLTVLLPTKRGFMNTVFSEMNQQLFNYVTGKFIEMIIVGSVSYVVFLILGLPYAVLISILVGLSVIIPFFGAFLVTIPVLLVGLYEWGLSDTFYWLLALYLIIQILDGNVLVPVLFSSRNNLHPVIILIAVLFFGGIWGFWGLFFAIPLATFIKAIFNAWPQPKDVNSS